MADLLIAQPKNIKTSKPETKIQKTQTTNTPVSSVANETDNFLGVSADTGLKGVVAYILAFFLLLADVYIGIWTDNMDRAAVIAVPLGIVVVVPIVAYAGLTVLSITSALLWGICLAILLPVNFLLEMWIRLWKEDKEEKEPLVKKKKKKKEDYYNIV